MRLLSLGWRANDLTVRVILRDFTGARPFTLPLHKTISGPRSFPPSCGGRPFASCPYPRDACYRWPTASPQAFHLPRLNSIECWQSPIRPPFFYNERRAAGGFRCRVSAPVQKEPTWRGVGWSPEHVLFLVAGEQANRGNCFRPVDSNGKQSVQTTCRRTFPAQSLTSLGSGKTVVNEDGKVEV